ncbi:MAG: S-methyl-5'-thioadenosine phosphorylase [Candidatus Bathyarchaeia archaeon]|nr:S-methyl-5'-thioadenosine phosphorylase [Candidatus Bathyarchaeota archaeon]
MNTYVKIGIIGGSGLEKILEGKETVEIKTPYNFSPKIYIGELNGKKIAFLPRHGIAHDVPPHKVNYRANIWALKTIGVKRVLATNAVGAINEKYKPGDFFIPFDLIDFTKSRIQTFFEEGKVIHVDCSSIYCKELREALIASIKNFKMKFWEGVLACTEGPRFETPAEIRMMKLLGCDAVGMTSAPEAFLAREAGLCYASLGFISNMAAGLQNRLTTSEVFKTAQKIFPYLKLILNETIKRIPEERMCECIKSLEESEI